MSPNDKGELREIESTISPLVEAYWLQGFGRAKTTLKKKHTLSGGTDSRLYIAHVKAHFVIKRHIKDSPQQKAGYRLLSKSSKSLMSHHLTRPIFSDKIDSSIYMMPLIDSSSLHDLINSDRVEKSWLLDDLYEDVLNEMKKLWQETKSMVRPDVVQLYLGRIQNRLPAIKEWLNFPLLEQAEIIVNDKNYGSLREILSKFRKELFKLKDKIKYSCTIHGDEHANNLLILNDRLNIDKTGWVLIDYVNSQKNSDWIFSIAKMLHWWDLYYHIAEAKKGSTKWFRSHLEIDRKRKIIRAFYDRQALIKKMPLSCKLFSKKVHLFASQTASKTFNEEKKYWQRRLKLALFSILFGSIFRHLDKKNEFAIPILLGESLKQYSG